MTRMSMVANAVLLYKRRSSLLRQAEKIGDELNSTVEQFTNDELTKYIAFTDAIDEEEDLKKQRSERIAVTSIASRHSQKER